ncbi:unnamed protein product [Toxocara canis]|uniref:Secreted protein n=1 Tax=Toxocara canis TaxID=6265 RepID=A0A183V150_TOXCA|nr:unnamed protein product [Toxocara canis]
MNNGALGLRCSSTSALFTLTCCWFIGATNGVGKFRSTVAQYFGRYHGMGHYSRRVVIVHHSKMNPSIASASKHFLTAHLSLKESTDDQSQCRCQERYSKGASVGDTSCRSRALSESHPSTV